MSVVTATSGVTAITGRELGTRPSRRLRSEGQLPGVLYGGGAEPLPVHVDYVSLRDALSGPAGLNTVLTIDVDGEQETVIVREIQRDPIKRMVTHADFMRVDERTKVKVEVPVILIGRASEVIDNGGMIEQKRHTLLVKVAPKDIPDRIEVDISGMDMDHRLAVSQLVLPDGVTSLIPGNLTVVATVVPRGLKSAEEEAELEEGEEGFEGEEGEEGEGEASAEDSGD